MITDRTKTRSFAQDEIDHMAARIADQVPERLRDQIELSRGTLAEAIASKIEWELRQPCPVAWVQELPDDGAITTAQQTIAAYIVTARDENRGRGSIGDVDFAYTLFRVPFDLDNAWPEARRILFPRGYIEAYTLEELEDDRAFVRHAVQVYALTGFSDGPTYARREVWITEGQLCDLLRPYFLREREDYRAIRPYLRPTEGGHRWTTSIKASATMRRTSGPSWPTSSIPSIRTWC